VRGSYERKAKKERGSWRKFLEAGKERERERWIANGFISRNMTKCFILDNVSFQKLNLIKDVAIKNY
jgi:hypothetical protein